MLDAVEPDYLPFDLKQLFRLLDKSPVLLFMNPSTDQGNKAYNGLHTHLKELK